MELFERREKDNKLFNNKEENSLSSKQADWTIDWKLLKL